MEYHNIRYLICSKRGWDYWTWASQPPWFIREIWDHMNAEMSAVKRHDFADGEGVYPGAM